MIVKTIPAVDTHDQIAFSIERIETSTSDLKKSLGHNLAQVELNVITIKRHADMLIERLGIILDDDVIVTD